MANFKISNNHKSRKSSEIPNLNAEIDARCVAHTSKECSPTLHANTENNARLSSQSHIPNDGSVVSHLNIENSTRIYPYSYTLKEGSINPHQNIENNTPKFSYVHIPKEGSEILHTNAENNVRLFSNNHNSKEGPVVPHLNIETNTILLSYSQAADEYPETPYLNTENNARLFSHVHISKEGLTSPHINTENNARLFSHSHSSNESSLISQINTENNARLFSYIHTSKEGSATPNIIIKNNAQLFSPSGFSNESSLNSDITTENSAQLFSYIHASKEGSANSHINTESNTRLFSHSNVSNESSLISHINKESNARLFSHIQSSKEGSATLHINTGNNTQLFSYSNISNDSSLISQINTENNARLFSHIYISEEGSTTPRINTENNARLFSHSDFSNESLLTSHINTENNARLFSYIHTSKGGLAPTHINTENNAQLFSPSVFSNESSVNSHIITENNARLFSYNHASKEGSATLHINTENNAQLFSHSDFSNESSLISHINTENNARLFSHIFISEEGSPTPRINTGNNARLFSHSDFLNESSLISNINTENNARIFSCIHSSKEGLANPSVNTENNALLFSPSGFSNESSLNAHIITENNARLFSYINSSKEGSANLHINTENNALLFSPSEFSNESSLNTHINTENNARLFSYINASREGSANPHINAENNARLFSHSDCSNESSLNSHIITENNARLSSYSYAPNEDSVVPTINTKNKEMKNLKICFWNANGLSQHKNEVQQFLHMQEIDVFLVSETHFTEKNCFKIHNYYTYDTKNPNGRACGGTAILVHKNIKHFPLPEYKTDHIQATSVDIIDHKLTISSVYCPPKYNINCEQFRNYFATLGPRFIAAGDYNAKHTFWGSRLITPRGRQLLQAISLSRLDSLSGGQPTYWPSDLNKIPDLIDFAVTKGLKRDCISVVPSLDLSSDHSPTILTILGTSGCLLTHTSCIPNKKTNWLKYKMFVSSHLPQSISLKSESEVQSAIDVFTDILTNAAVASTPTNISRKRNTNCSREVELILREKRKLRRQWQESRSPGIKAQLNQCQRRLRIALKNQKELGLKNYLQSLDNTKDTDYSLWKAVKSMQCPIAYESPIRKENGQWAKNSTEKVEALANHLENAFTPNDTNSFVSPTPINDMVPHPLKFRLPAVKTAIKSLKAKKSPGTDKITSEMISFLPDSAIRLILFIFNAILRIGYYPTSWKLSEIVMIPKPGKDVSQVTSYRPISLLSILSKLFEKLLFEKLLLYLDVNQSIPNHQFGFRRQHSTIEQVHRITNLIRQSFENKQYCSALFIDISQAFDKVWHDGLIHKIIELLPENVHKLLKNYITDRYFHIRSKNVISSRRKISAGVPQGSILGPLLYILYTADMPTSPLTHTSTFADDTAFLSIHKDPTIASEQLQAHMKLIEEWLCKWKIKVNVSKCVHITFTLRRENCPPIQINNVNVPEQNKVKYLGIHLDRRLTWSHHIEAKVAQIKLKTNELYWLIGTWSSLDLEYKVLLYKSIIKPIWLYGIQLWGTASSSNIEKLQRRQAKLLRIITGAPWFVRNRNIHNDLNIPTVREEIRKCSINYAAKLAEHPNALARGLLYFEGHRRLRRIETLDLII